MARKRAKIRFKDSLLQENFKYGPANITRSDKINPIDGRKGGDAILYWCTYSGPFGLWFCSSREPLPPNISTTGTSLYCMRTVVLASPLRSGTSSKETDTVLS